jgi:glutamate-1-semialdehyde 2,1-aminomutase
LKEISNLKDLKKAKNCAALLLNPLQYLFPRKSIKADALLFIGNHPNQMSLDEYKEYLKEIRKICEEKGILLILDEVFLGFRLAYGGCQEYFNIKADMVLYGKTLGGRLPVGVVCNIENPFPYCNFGMPMYLLLQKYPLTHLWIFQFFHK